MIFSNLSKSILKFLCEKFVKTKCNFFTPSSFKKGRVFSKILISIMAKAKFNSLCFIFCDFLFKNFKVQEFLVKFVIV